LGAVCTQNKLDLCTTALDLFVKMSENDPVLNVVTGGKWRSHGDGWGLAGIGIARGERGVPAVLFHKSIIPVYDPYSLKILELFKSRILRLSGVYLIAHSRLSSASEPYGERYAHPFEVRFGDTNYLWLVHNGGIDKVSLARELESLNPYYYTDSWIAAIYLAKRLEQCVKTSSDLDNCVAEVYMSLAEYVKEGSALDTALLLLYSGEPALYATYYTRGLSDPALEEYHRLYALTGESSWIVASSTIKHYTQGATSLEQGVYRVDEKGLRKIESFTH